MIPGAGERIVAALGELAARELLEVLERSSASRAIKAVSSALLERGAIDGAEVVRLVEEAERR
jgi:hypothetical protein